MVTLSAPSALDAMAIPSTAVAFQGPGATGPAEAGNGQDSQSSFHQTYKDAEAEAATPAPPVSGRDSKDAAKKSTPAKDNVRNDNAAAVVPPPALTAEALARLTLSPSLSPKADSSATGTRATDLETRAAQDKAGKSSEPANGPRSASPSALLTGIPALIEIPMRAAEKTPADSSLPATSPPQAAASTERAAPQAILAPRVEPLAFAIQLHHNEARPGAGDAGPRVSEAAATDQEAASREVKPATASTQSEHSGRDSTQDDDTNTARPQITPAGATFTAAREIAAESPTPEAPPPVVPTHAPTAATGTRLAEPIAAEPPRVDSSSPILLRVSGPDQSTASVRVQDRGGAVNVQVHASDPELRDSLRSNLGDLASQLNSHGWKTDAAKPAIATHSENNANNQHNGQRSFSQRDQATPGDRQSQRDRRANADRWVSEFDEQSSSSVTKGGKS